MSVSFWVKETDRAKPHPDQQVQERPYAHVISNVNIEANNGWYFDHSYNDQAIRFVVTDTSGGLTISESMPISNNSFTHIAATFDGSLIEVYKNGELFQILNYDGNYSSAHNLPIHIGSASHCNSCNEFSSTVDDISLYNRTISEDEIKQLYLGNENSTATSNGLNPNKGLVGHWSFDNTLDDLSIYKNNAQMFTLLSSMVSTPDDRIFISEKNTGKIKIMKDGILLDKPFAVINDSYVGWEQGLLGLALDPEFKENHFVYLYYTSTNGEGNYPVNKVIRLTEKDNVAINTTVLLDNLPAGIGYHSGGALGFGPDNKLYITVGDATEEEHTQSNSSLLGKILRINKDGTIPSDNPIPNSPIYTLGHRNMFGIAFDNKDNIGIVTENGDELYDEINIIKKGGNYGYPIFQLPNIAPELSNSTLDIKPLRAYLYPQGPTQALYYVGDTYSALKDNFLFGTYTGDIYGIHVDNVSETIDSELRIQLDHYPFEAVNGITQTSDGYVYFGANHIYRLDSASEEEDSEQVLYPMTITRSNNIGIDSIFPERDTSVIIDLRSTPNDSGTNMSQFIKLKMPKSIIDEIGNVTYTAISQNESPQRNIPFSVVDLDSKYSEVTIPIGFHFSNIRIIINSNDSDNCGEEAGSSGTDFSECQILEGEIEQAIDIENSQEENQDSIPDPNPASDTNEVFSDENVQKEENDGEGNDGEGNDGEGNENNNDES
ncbi:MAG: PQQ-dependent sugar dehydrogenase [Candidatus Nitrosocosmicus sp.]|nr:PQQ-dependent sugar dehydrogenase [Candidatus Nitrosocosmicus sp.]